MSVWTDFENWRDNIHCGGEPEEERKEAEIGAKYELWDNVNGRVTKIITCTEENKMEIERNLNDKLNDIWCYRKIIQTNDNKPAPEVTRAKGEWYE